MEIIKIIIFNMNYIFFKYNEITNLNIIKRIPCLKFDRFPYKHIKNTQILSQKKIIFILFKKTKINMEEMNKK
jgi:hypothetical protein